MTFRRFFSLTLGAVLLLAAVPSPTEEPLERPDPRIAAMLAAISPADLRATDLRLVAFGTRNAFSEQLNSPNRGVFAARDWIRSQFEAIARQSNGRMTVSYDTYVQPKTDRTPRAVTISSVIAVLAGDDPDRRTYVISSHYDSRNSDGNNATLDAPGADDNGSGTSAVLEAAKVLARSPVHGTVVFACFDGEEQGLFGSEHYAAVARAQGANIVADLNNDIIGASVGPHGERAPYTVRIFSEALPLHTDVRRVNLVGSENDSPSRELARFVKSTAQVYVPNMDGELIYRSDRFLRGGDEESFTGHGYPAMRFVEKYENYAHQHQTIRIQDGVQYGDLPAYVDYDYLARVTQMNVAALAALALGPGQPGNAQMLTKALGYDTTLRWTPAARATAYELVWRDTTSPVWQHALNVGNVSQATLPVSKDDFIIGVRAVDAQGLRSPVVYPTPARD